MTGVFTQNKFFEKSSCCNQKTNKCWDLKFLPKFTRHDIILKYHFLCYL